jgi:hypothetical protein
VASAQKNRDYLPVLKWKHDARETSDTVKEIWNSLCGDLLETDSILGAQQYGAR